MQFHEFSKLLQNLEEISSRNEMVELLASFMTKLDSVEVSPVMYMLKGRLVPGFVPLEFNFSTNLLVRAITEGYGLDLDEIKNRNSQFGDVGLVVESIVPDISCDLSIVKVYGSLLDMIKVEGTGAQSIKSRMFIELIKKLDKLSAKFVSRIVVGNLRIGLSDKTILESLSWAIKQDKSLKDEIEKAYGLRSDLGQIAEIIISGEVDSLENIEIQPGIPVASKLVQRESSIKSALDRMGVALVQPKYDGLRVQIHYNKMGFEDLLQRYLKTPLNLGLGLGMDSIQKVRLFSRNMESLTDMFPDIVEEISNKQIDSIVLDCEAIGVDPVSDKFISFQETVKRKRKYDVKTKSKGTPVKVFVFDILYLNGKDLSQYEFSKRMEILNKLFGQNEFKKSEVLKLSKTEIYNDPLKLEQTFRTYLDAGLEGVIIKDQKSRYLPGTRNYDWIKIKANTYSELIDDIDCVVLGYYAGRGSRAKHGAGAFLVGVYNQATEKFETIAKVGSGIKDDQWTKFISDVDSTKVVDIPKNVVIHKDLLPDVLCDPKIVVVINADEISKSKKHTAGKAQDGIGYSLRFPRLKEWNRMDKSAIDITTVEEVKKIYKLKYEK